MLSLLTLPWSSQLVTVLVRSRLKLSGGCLNCSKMLSRGAPYVQWKDVWLNALSLKCNRRHDFRLQQGNGSVGFSHWMVLNWLAIHFGFSPALNSYPTTTTILIVAVVFCQVQSQMLRVQMGRHISYYANLSSGTPRFPECTDSTMPGSLPLLGRSKRGLGQEGRLHSQHSKN